MTKITIIGAGSVEFTRNVMADLASFRELHGDLTISLLDIDPERLDYAERAARQVVEVASAGYRVEAFDEQRPAFDGADYLVNEIQVGGYAATTTDFEVPMKYGVRQTIADTLGIGGIMRGLRTIPVVAAMGRDMAEVCPGALLLNYTNPMAMVPWGVYAGSPFTNVVGVCHSVRDTHSFLAEAVGVAESDVAFRTAGFNHQCFVYTFRDRRTGEDLYPRLREIVEADAEGLGRRVRVEIFRRFGYYPTESSEHSSEYVPWVLKRPDQIERFRILVNDYIYRCDENLAEYEAMKRALDAGEMLPLEPTSELASEIIHSIETGTPREVYGNVRNGGLIDGLPEDACVEVPCLVDKNGVQPTRMWTLPPQTLALNRTFVNVVELTVRAALEESRSLVYQAALVDPNTAATLATDEIVSMVDDLITAHGDLIPEGIRRG
jgi:alpha-galactosidase